MGAAEASDSRLSVLRRWVVEDLGFAASRIEPASSDASFRRYFRVTRGADTYIVMDAPPEKESLLPFIGVAHILLGMGVNAPVILARNIQQGLLLLSDLGQRQYLDELHAGGDVDLLYADAMHALVKMQSAGAAAAHALPRYDRNLLLAEMQLMPEWFFGAHLKLEIDAAERGMLDRLFEFLIQAALAQPTAFVHRDYHSRNLLLTARNNPGVLDFQDAVLGPVSYDLVSLLKDCYIAWDPARVRGWVREFRERLLHAGLAAGEDEAQFVRWFDLIGLQRHIKVLGIFSRLNYRDGKSQYLDDLPRVLEYTRGVAGAYAETAEFAAFLAARIRLG
jgi:aminoglycoside/choline kinase family phosphotransferase